MTAQFRHFRIALALPLAAAMLAPAPASAKVTGVAANGFALVEATAIDAEPDAIWQVLVEPSLWWNSDHSFTGQAIYFTLDPVPGGCFCETIPAEGESGGGGVRHMEVVYAEKPRVLRMVGGIGPLQGEAVNATFTLAMEKREEGGSTVSLSYVVGGYMRSSPAKLARTLDTVMGEALARLAAAAEGRDPASVRFTAPEIELPDLTPAGAETDEGGTDAESKAASEAESADSAAEETNGEAEAAEQADTANKPQAEAEEDKAPRQAPLSSRLDLLFDEEPELAGGTQGEADAEEEAAGDDPVKDDVADAEAAGEDSADGQDDDAATDRGEASPDEEDRRAKIDLSDLLAQDGFEGDVEGEKAEAEERR